MVPDATISSGRNRTIIVVLLVLLFSSCLPPSPGPFSPTPTVSQFLPPTIAETPTTTLIPVPSLTPTDRPVPTLTSMSTQTLSPSLTPLPTIPSGEWRRKSEVLLATNGGCRLPCFWGLTPGVTTNAELEQFFDQFPSDAPEGILDGQHKRYTFFYFTARTGDSPWSVSFWTDPQKLTSIFLDWETAQYSFPLAKILNDYGLPEQVYIGAPDAFEDGLAMIVLYGKQQFAGRYVLWGHELDKTLYCYDPQAWNQYVVTWAPGEDWLRLLDQKEEALKPLAEVSDYGIPALHEKLKVPNRALCLHVQTDKVFP